MPKLINTVFSHTLPCIFCCIYTVEIVTSQTWQAFLYIVNNNSQAISKNKLTQGHGIIQVTYSMYEVLI